MKPEDYEKLTIFERQFLMELMKIRVALERVAEAVEDAEDTEFHRA